MSSTQHLPEQHSLSLKFVNEQIEREFQASYDRSIRVPLLQGIIISIISWFASFGLVYALLPEKAYWMVPLTFVVIGSYFGFIVYATATKKFQGYYHLLGAISNAWAGLYAIFYCHQFPNGAPLTLPVLIFIIFFGSYMVRLRWIAGGIAALSYTIGYCWYVLQFSEMTFGETAFYFFVIWMTFFFAVIAGRSVEMNSRISYIQRKIIDEQNGIIEHEKQVLLQEVHHRVKNNLQVIISLINLELSKNGRVQNTDTLKKIQSRILSMSLVHLWMKQSSDFEEISLKKYTENLVKNLQDFRMHHDDVQFTADIPESLNVDLETAIPLGIALNEIITNFFEHCSVVKDANFNITVKEDQDGLYKLAYRDNGPGFPEGTSVDDESKFGLELIEVLADQLEGEFSFTNQNGAVYEMTFKPSFN